MIDVGGPAALHVLDQVRLPTIPLPHLPIKPVLMSIQLQFPCRNSVARLFSLSPFLEMALGRLRVLRRSIEGGFFCYPYFTN